LLLFALHQANFLNDFGQEQWDCLLVEANNQTAARLSLCWCFLQKWKACTKL
jgi:hypothetical protein